MANKSQVVVFACERNYEGAEEALQKQRERLESYCEESGYLVNEEITVIGNRQDRLSALRKAIECAKEIEGNTLVMSSIKKGVDMIHTEIKLIEEAGIYFVTVDGSYDAYRKYGLPSNMMVGEFRPHSDDEVQNMEPIIDRETWEKAQAVLKNKG
jgi:hypothetical protein